MDTLQPWQSQPVFVTSTFQDMQAERDYLLTHVFPALEEWLATRHRHLEWVDLRVGVSTAADETSRELMILKVCFDEVRRSRPFLIGLLGDRYGWVPPVERAAAAASEIGFDARVAERSVTDLEIDFGALSDLEQGRRALIFLRAPLPYDAMPPELAALYCDARAKDPGAASRAERLARLKARLRRVIPQRCFEYDVVWDPRSQRVTGLDAWGRVVEERLRTALAQEFANDPVPAELTWQQAELAALANFIEDRTRGFAGRAGTVERIERILEAPVDEGSPWGVCITGEAGAGKTALFGEIYKRLRARGWIVLAHAPGASTQSPAISVALRRFVAELMTQPDPIHVFRFTDQGELFHGDIIKAALSDAPTEEQVYAALGLLLSWTTSAGRRVIMLIDALDQIEPISQARFVAWLETNWPAGARLLVTTTPGAASTTLSNHQGLTSLSVPPLAEAEAREIASGICDRYHRRLEPLALEALIGKRGDPSPWTLPLWLVLAVEELNLLDADDFARASRDYQGRDEERLAALMCDLIAGMPADVQGLYRTGIARAEALFGERLVCAFLSAIAVSRFGWREGDFSALLPRLGGGQWDELQFASLRRLFRGQLRRREPLGRWDFVHGQGRLAVRQWLGEIAIDERAVHAAIVDHLLALPPGDPVRISEVMLHLMESEDWTRAARYLGALKAEGAETAGALAVLTDALRSPSERSPEEAAQRLVLTLEAAGIDDVTRARVAERIMRVHYQTQGRCRLAAEKIILTGVEKCLSEIVARHPENPDLGEQHARSLTWMGHLRKDEGDLEGALEAYREADAIRQLVGGRQVGRAEKRKAGAGNSLAIGDALLAKGDFDGALACYRDPSNEGSSVALGRVGVVLRMQGDLTGALAALRKGMALLQQDVAKDPRNQPLRFNLGIAHSTIASTLAGMQDLEGALGSYRAAMEVLSPVASQNPTDPAVQAEWAVLHLRIAYVLRRQANSADALAYLQRGIPVIARIVAAHPDSPHYQRYLALFELEVGEIVQMQGNEEAALGHWRSAASLFEQLAAHDPTNADWQRDLAVTLGRIAPLLQSRGDRDAALEVFRRELPILEWLAARDRTGTRWQQELEEARASVAALAASVVSAPSSSHAARVASSRTSWLARTLSRLHLRH